MSGDGAVQRYADFGVAPGVRAPQTWQVPRATFDHLLLVRHATASWRRRPRGGIAVLDVDDRRGRRHRHGAGHRAKAQSPHAVRAQAIDRCVGPWRAALTQVRPAHRRAAARQPGAVFSALFRRSTAGGTSRRRYPHRRARGPGVVLADSNFRRADERRGRAAEVRGPGALQGIEPGALLDSDDCGHVRRSREPAGVGPARVASAGRKGLLVRLARVRRRSLGARGRRRIVSRSGVLDRRRNRAGVRSRSGAGGRCRSGDRRSPRSGGSAPSSAVSQCRKRCIVPSVASSSWGSTRRSFAICSSPKSRRRRMFRALVTVFAGYWRPVARNACMGRPLLPAGPPPAVGAASLRDSWQAARTSMNQPPLPAETRYWNRGEDRQRVVNTLFDRSAEHYDRACDIMSFGSGQRYRREALNRAGLRPGMRVLDVGTGTGLLAREIVRVLGSKQVVGLDPSWQMMAAGRRQLGIRFVQGLGERLPFPAAHFDFLTMGYALRHVSDLDQAFAEYRRVLKPGGRVLLLEITRPASTFGLSLARLYFGAVRSTRHAHPHRQRERGGAHAILLGHDRAVRASRNGARLARTGRSCCAGPDGAARHFQRVHRYPRRVTLTRQRGEGQAPRHCHQMRATSRRRKRSPSRAPHWRRCRRRIRGPVRESSPWAG